MFLDSLMVGVFYDVIADNYTTITLSQEDGDIIRIKLCFVLGAILPGFMRHVWGWTEADDCSPMLLSAPSNKLGQIGYFTSVLVLVFLETSSRLHVVDDGRNLSPRLWKRSPSRLTRYGLFIEAMLVGPSILGRIGRRSKCSLAVAAVVASHTRLWALCVILLFISAIFA